MMVSKRTQNQTCPQNMSHPKIKSEFFGIKALHENYKNPEEDAPLRSKGQCGLGAHHIIHYKLAENAGEMFSDY